MTVVELTPVGEGCDPLVLVDTLSVRSLTAARAMVRLYQHRWTIETAFETMHAWGQDAFMVRSWRAIDRLLLVLAGTYLLAILLLTDPSCRSVRHQAVRLLNRLSVLGRRLTIGKLAQAVGPDFVAHPADWRLFASP